MCIPRLEPFICFTLAAPFAAASDGPPWPLTQELLASDGGGYLGHDLALSGDRALLGAHIAPGAPGNFGAAYVFDFDGSAWVETAKLVRSGPPAPDGFGFRVGLDGDVAAVGAPEDGELGIEAGAVWVYRRTAGTWTVEAKLLPDPPAYEDEFGCSVAVFGERVVVGAQFDDDLGYNSGAVYVFRHDGLAWTREAKLLLPSPSIGAYFGYDVAIDGERIAAVQAHVGTPAFVYVHQAGAWSLEQSLSIRENPQPTALSISIDGDTLAFGAPYYGAGRAWVFTRSGGNWQQEGFLRKFEDEWGDVFGESIAVSGERIAVGASGVDTPLSNAGAVYLFERIGKQWFAEREFIDPDGQAIDRFGTGIDLEAERLLVGALHNDDAKPSGGAGFVFDTEGFLGVPYCFGDGSGTTCPCNNESTLGAGLGCASSRGDGARLDAFGSTSVAADDLELRSLPLIPGHAALLFAGTGAVNGGNGVTFGDGLRCAGSGVVRLGVEFPDSPDGCAHWGPKLGALGGFDAGDVRYLQVWYRDAGGGPCGSTFNLTNGLELAFVP